MQTPRPVTRGLVVFKKWAGGGEDDQAGLSTRCSGGSKRERLVATKIIQQKQGKAFTASCIYVVVMAVRNQCSVCPNFALFSPCRLKLSVCDLHLPRSSHTTPHKPLRTDSQEFRGMECQMSQLIQIWFHSTFMEIAHDVWSGSRPCWTWP